MGTKTQKQRELLRREFEKRLASHLKRYGLSKCSFGTFWADR